jgi:hypothetical protein
MSVSLPPLFYVDFCIVPATPTIVELMPPGELSHCHFTSFLLCWLLCSMTILVMWHSLPWQTLDDHLAGSCHHPHRRSTAYPLPLEDCQTGKRTVLDSIPMMAPICPPHHRMDLHTTGRGFLPGPPWRWNGCHCCLAVVIPAPCRTR